MPYGERDRDFFFGRARDTRIIAANVRGSRLTLLYGESGVGKSSLLRAGVVPRLRAPRAAAAGRLRRGRPAVAHRPREELAEALRRSIQEVSGAELAPWRRGGSLADAVREWTAHVPTALLILDQFEEYFLYHPDEHGPDSVAEPLAELINDPGLHVHALISIREDALSRLDRFKATIPGLFGNYLRIDHLDRASARGRSSSRSRSSRRLPPGEEPVTIEPALVEAVLDQVRAGRLKLGDGNAAVGTAADPGGDRVETPFLQLVMERLWTTTMQRGGRHLSLATLEELGGAESIVSRHLGEVLAELGPERERLAADLFAFLVTPSMTKIAQAPSDLGYWTHRPLEDVEAVLAISRAGSGGSCAPYRRRSAATGGSSATRSSTTSSPRRSPSGVPPRIRSASVRTWPRASRWSAPSGRSPSGGGGGRLRPPAAPSCSPASRSSRSCSRWPRSTPPASSGRSRAPPPSRARRARTSTATPS